MVVQVSSNILAPTRSDAHALAWFYCRLPSDPGRAGSVLALFDLPCYFRKNIDYLNVGAVGFGVSLRPNSEARLEYIT